MDALKGYDEKDDVDKVGTRIVLPSSHKGSPRDLTQRFQDAMAVVRVLGKPHLFLTMTCNPEWPEIKAVIDEWHAEAADCPTIVGRVFKLKWDFFMDDIIKRQVFGRVKGYMWVIEFQKRGLPHAHCLVILESKDAPVSPEDFDEFVSAEIPDPVAEPHLFELVMKHQIHVCGDRVRGKPCCKEGHCTKGFPKSHVKRTIKVDNEYPKYMRRSVKDGGQKVIRNEGQEKEYTVTNGDVIPYNPAALLRVQSHFCAEICSSISAVKYIFKYMLKGPDHISYKLAPVQDKQCAGDGKQKQSVSGNGKNDKGKPEDPQVVNEVSDFRQARWWAPPEAFWKIAGFTVHKQMPSVMRLPVHLEHQQNVFSDLNNLETGQARSDLLAAAERSEKSPLKQWFEMNKSEIADPQDYAEGTSAPELLYSEMPTYYTWNSPTHKSDWFRRSNVSEQFPTISRMYTVHVNDAERYFLRRLLFYVRGATCFEDMRTFVGEVCKTFRDACLRRNLLADDKEWDRCMNENKDNMTAGELRHLLFLIFVECQPSDPYNLFFSYADVLSDDYLLRLIKHDENTETTELHKTSASFEALFDIEKRMFAVGMVLDIVFETKEYVSWKSDYSEENEDEAVNVLVNEELDYIPDVQANQAKQFYESMHTEQKLLHDSVIQMVAAASGEDPKPRMIFADAPGGTGKTYVNTAICFTLRGQGKIVIVVASSGIAAQLLPGGRTAHFKFQIPIDLHEYSSCFISNDKRNTRAQLIRKASLIIIDEASMLHKHGYEAMDRTLQDILGNDDIPFGGIPVLFTGDFRQILPVVKQGSRYQIMEASLQRSKLWEHIQVIHLTENMRLQLRVSQSQTDLSAIIEYGEFLLRVGDGSETRYPSRGEEVTKLPHDIVSKSRSIEDMIEETFGN